MARYAADCMHCPSFVDSCQVIGVRLDILVAEAGAVGNPQRKIVAARQQALVGSLLWTPNPKNSSEGSVSYTTIVQHITALPQGEGFVHALRPLLINFLVSQIQYRTTRLLHQSSRNYRTTYFIRLKVQCEIQAAKHTCFHGHS